MNNLRDYGLPDMGRPSGKPTWNITKPEIECPNCGAILCEVTVKYDKTVNPLMDGLLGEGDKSGIYLGCPACPFASPCIFTKNKDIKKYEQGSQKESKRYK